MRKFVAIGPAFVVLISLAAVMLAGPAAIRQMVFASQTGEVMLARQVLDDDDILERIDRAVSNIAASVQPSIAHLEVTVSSENRRSGFGSSGSAWVYDQDGHIVTNAHVVGEAETIRVEFADGRSMRGEIVESDSFTDIAVVKVDPGVGLIPVRRATGDRVRVGERVFAFGSPFNFKFSMSEGIVSGLGRNPQTSGGSAAFTNYIQTDAAVNPGNSGGPLVNIRGEVVGMNVAIATGNNRRNSEGQSAGISFAIPLTVIESVVDQIIEQGEVKRGFLGISSNSRFRIRSVEDKNGDYFGRGVFVGTVTPNLAADRAGIEEGDIITEIDGNRITQWHHLASVVSTVRPGSTVSVRLWRDGEELEFPVTLAERPLNTISSDPRVLTNALIRTGIGVRDVSQPGLLVEYVRPDSDADDSGFRVGDRIVEVNGERVEELLDFYAILTRSGYLRGSEIEIVVIDEDDDRRTRTLVLNR